MATAPLGLAFTGNKSILQIANAIKAKRPSVIGLRFQNCTGCTEALLRTSAPGVAPLILDVISLDYHEPLMAASGAQAEAALRSAMAENAGSYVLGVEGAIPTRDDSVYMQMGRQTCGSGGEGSGSSGGGSNLHGLLCFLGWRAFCRSKPHGRGWSGFHHLGQTDY